MTKTLGGTHLFLFWILLTLVSCAGSTTRSFTPVPSRFPRMEQRIHEMVNEYRARRGLPVLVWNEVAASECRRHCSKMATTDTWLGHDGFDDRADAIAERVRYRRAGENVANNSGFEDPVTAVVTGWLESTYHRENIEGDFNATGIGVDQSLHGYYYYTQIFLKQR
jgi:uncharacterized protein YkwD